ncbi:hypothetical protein [Winogradskyella sp. MIT101101]|uniref:hypothetical protein n=1 Tax=Winogradskyella sp. MIT101101 TaxID=3098297 RepID=UPI00399A3E04
MKKILTLTFFMCSMFYAMAQTDGITYQAVIIGPDDLELPGVDSEGNYLPNTTIAVRFTIYDSTNQIEFQEIQITETDDFGRINLLIGEAEHDYFKEISWDGTPKDLKVEIDFDAGNNFETMSRETLTFLPYAFHRNITATGTLTVDDKTFLNGELEVEGPTNLFSSLTVHNNNPTLLTGDLTVDGITNLNNALNVNNGSATNLTGDLNVSQNSALDGTLDVIGLTTLNDLTVNGEASFGDLTAENLKVTDSTHLDGGLNITSDSQVKITSSLQGSELDIKNYPLLIEGGTQGIAIKVETQGARNENNFISFWDNTTPSTNLAFNPIGISGVVSDIFDIVGIDDTGIFDSLSSNPEPGANTVSGIVLPDATGPMLWGRIEGETSEDEFTNNADYNADFLGTLYDTVDGTLDFAWEFSESAKQAGDFAAALSSSTGCAGIGACVTAPIPSIILNETSQNFLQVVKQVAASANLAFSGYMLQAFANNKLKFKGVSYASGAGDYAEYLRRSNPDEEMVYGEIVGVKGGKISKQTNGAERMMVISYKPAVLGALPQEREEPLFEKVAFMGQVPVRVIGKVNIGDYILPSGNNDGFGVAVSPDKISSKDIKNIVGVAWDSSDKLVSFKLINTAVGINNNDNNPIVIKLEQQVALQSKEINELKTLLQTTIQRIEAIENSGDAFKGNTNVAFTQADEENIAHDGRRFERENDVIYFEISDEELEEGLRLAEKMLRKQGITKSQEYVITKIKEDAAFKAKIMNKMKESLKNQIHFHKEINRGDDH